MGAGCASRMYDSALITPRKSHDIAGNNSLAVCPWMAVRWGDMLGMAGEERCLRGNREGRDVRRFAVDRGSRERARWKA